MSLAALTLATCIGFITLAVAGIAPENTAVYIWRCTLTERCWNSQKCAVWSG